MFCIKTQCVKKPSRGLNGMELTFCIINLLHITKLSNEKYCNNTSLMATGLSQNLSSKNNNFLSESTSMTDSHPRQRMCRQEKDLKNQSTSSKWKTFTFKGNELLVNELVSWRISYLILNRSLNIQDSGCLVMFNN